MNPLHIKVMVIGEKGAGKTVYLAGLHRHLSIEREENVVTIKTKYADSLLLNETYRQVIDPRAEFPASTLWLNRIWKFDCKLSNGLGDFTPLSVSYADYDGRMLDPPSHGMDVDLETDPALRDHSEFADSADAFLVIIDGYRLLRLLRGDPELEHWLDTYLPPQLAKLRAGPRKDAETAPVHFVITKWDLLDQLTVDGKPVTLGTVRDRLLEQKDLASYLRLRFRNGMGVVRLIPVSVTGPFAKLEAGRIIKAPGKPVHAMNVDIPFIALLPDYLSVVIAEAQRSGHATLDDATHRLRRNAALLGKVRGFAALAHGPLASLLSRQLFAKGGKMAGLAVKEVVDNAFETFDSYLANQEKIANRRIEDLQEEHFERQRKVADEQEAFKLALESFQLRVKAFEEANPGSVLQGGTGDI